LDEGGIGREEKRRGREGLFLSAVREERECKKNSMQGNSSVRCGAGKKLNFLVAQVPGHVQEGLLEESKAPYDEKKSLREGKNKPRLKRKSKKKKKRKKGFSKKKPENF
jgi:hypothetical protein